MEKYNREFNEQRIEISRSRTIDNVMDRIKAEKSFWSFFKPIKMKLLMTVLVAVLLVVVIFATNTPVTPYTPVALTEYQTKKLVETSYMSASIISNATISATSTTLSYLPLADQETEFEKNIDDFNYYFNMLKVFIDDEAFMDNAVFENLTDSIYDYKISYLVENKQYVFLLKIDKEGEITGEITIGSKVLTVEGTFEEKSDGISLDLVARSNNDYIVIEYESETDDEIQKQYKIKQSINNIYIEKEISIEIEDDKTKVSIKQGEDSYNLEKHSENGVTVYYLEYEVNDLEGEVYITESIDEFGKTVYSYHINEQGFEKDIELDDPDEDDEDDEDEEDTEDEEDEEDDDLNLIFMGLSYNI